MSHAREPDLRIVVRPSSADRHGDRWVDGRAISAARLGVRAGGGSGAFSDHTCLGVALRLTYGAGGSFSKPPTAGMSYRSPFPEVERARLRFRKRALYWRLATAYSPMRSPA